MKINYSSGSKITGRSAPEISGNRKKIRSGRMAAPAIKNSKTAEDEKDQEAQVKENILDSLTAVERKKFGRLSERKQDRYITGTLRRSGKKSLSRSMAARAEAGSRHSFRNDRNRQNAEDERAEQKLPGNAAENSTAKASGSRNIQESVQEAPAPEKIKSTGTETFKETSAVAGTGTGTAPLPAAAARKTAAKFREALTARAAARSEDIRQSIQRSGKEKIDRGMDAGGIQGAGLVLGGAVLVAAAQIAGAALMVFAGIISMLAAVLVPALVFFLVLCTVAAVITAAVWTEQNRAGYAAGYDIVNVALNEADQGNANDGGQKYKSWYGMNADWCAMFVSWCADQCGFVASGTFTKSASVAVIRQFYDGMGRYHLKQGYVPVPGDLIVYGASGSSHIGIVAAADETAGTVTTVEGNTGSSGTSPYHLGSHVQKKTKSLADGWIHGYCHPDYPATGYEISGDSNREIIFNFFVSSGYSEAAAAAVVGNFCREAGMDASGDILLHTTEDNGQGIGIAQWSYGRKKNFLDYARSRGEPWPETSLAVQLEFLQMEMSQPNMWIWTSYAAGYYDPSANISSEGFKSCRDIRTATAAFCAKFERPRFNARGLELRIKYAQQAYDDFANK